jgi:hypothetical protein
VKRRIIRYRKVRGNNKLHEQRIFGITEAFPNVRVALFEIRPEHLANWLIFKPGGDRGIKNKTGKNRQAEFREFICLAATNSQKVLVDLLVDGFFLAKKMYGI